MKVVDRNLNRDFILNEWAPALRSGKYKQGTLVLRHRDEYCCLGVACDLLVKKGVLPPWKIICNDLYAIDNQTSELPKQAIEYIGFTDPHGNISDYILSDLNDKGWTFEEIACLLESEAAEG